MTRVAFPCDKAVMKGVTDRLRKARVAAGYKTAAAAARAHSWNSSTYRAHENGQNNFEYLDAIDYGKAFNVNAMWLCGWGDLDDPPPYVQSNFLPGHMSQSDSAGGQFIRQAADRSLTDRQIEAQQAMSERESAHISLSQPDELNSLPADVPVYGTAMGGDGDEDFNLNGDVVNYVRRPHGIARMRGVFGIYVQGDSMSPRHRAGELRYVTSAQAPGIGDDIILEIFDETHRHEDGVEPSARGILKELVRRTSETYIVRQHNPPREFEIERSRIKRVFRVLTTNDLLG